MTGEPASNGAIVSNEAAVLSRGSDGLRLHAALARARPLDPDDLAITKPEVTSARWILHINRRCDGR